MSLYDSNHACEKCGRGLRASTPPWLCERCDAPPAVAAGCQGKEQYASPNEAHRVLDHRNKRHRRAPPKHRMGGHVYKCPHCHHHHIGTSPK